MLFRHPRLKLLTQSLSVAAAAYFAALLSAEVSQLREVGGFTKLGFNVVAVVVITTVVVFVVRLFREGPDLRLRRRSAVLATAHSQVDSCVTNELSRFTALVQSGTSPNSGPGASLLGIEELVRGLYTCVDSHYSASDVPGERVNFEVTFMTKDAVDGAITILAWASRDGRAPKSLTEQANRRDIYDTTVTADLYRQALTRQPTARIISVTDETYSELYPGQKDRIRSSIVYPVLSGVNSLLGTLVVHCDKEAFFRASDEKYWRDLLEIFASRVALGKAKYDWEARSGDSSGVQS